MGEGKRRGAVPCVAVVLLLAVNAVIALVPAQAAASTDLVDEVIVVTGSRIGRADGQLASPAVAFDRVEINQFRELNLEEFLNQLPQVVPEFGRATNNPGDGTASVNLRGLGRSRTLVLLNGRRLAPTGTGSAIDINSIPGALLERVEVSTGGSSAVYGADAVSGAVNFTTRSDLDGLEISAQADLYGEGDGESYSTTVVAGSAFANGAGRVLAYADFLERKALRGGDRRFTDSIVSEDRAAGELFDEGSFRIPEGIIFAPLAPIDGSFAFPVFNADGSVRAGSLDDSFNFALDNYIQTPQTRYAGGVFFDYEVTPAIALFSELMFARSESDRQLAPTGIRLNVPLVIDSPFFADSTRELLRSTYDGDGDGIGQALFARRTSELGPRRTNLERDSLRVVLGFDTSLSDRWNLVSAVTYDRVDTDAAFQNDLSQSRLLQGLLVDATTGTCVDPSGGCVPVNLFGAGNISAEAAAFVGIDEFTNRDQSEQLVATATVSGRLFALAAGDANLAAGIEYRRNESSFSPSPVFASGEALGFSGGFVNSQGRSGSIEATEIFAELLVPLVSEAPWAHRLELEGGARFSHYSSTGDEWTWKAGGQWLPTPALRLRAMWQRAVRAPNVEELRTEPSVALGQIRPQDDFCLAANDPVGRGLADICLAQGMAAAQLGVYDVDPRVTIEATQIIRGNPDLQPEQADSLTAGISYTFERLDGLQLALDYFDYQIKDAISFIENPLSICAIEGDPSSAQCRAVTRMPSGLPETFTQQSINLAEAKVSGFDFSASWSTPVPAWLAPASGASFSVRALGTYYREFGQQATGATPFVDCAGGFENLCGVAVGLDVTSATTFPDRMFNTTLQYETSRLSAALRWRWVGSMDNLAPVFASLAGQGPLNLPIRKVSAKHYLDAAAEVNVTPALRLRFGVDNLTETDPPLLGLEALQSNTDPSRYDIFGRRFFLGVELLVGGN